jgi:hypothetical protein
VEGQVRLGVSEIDQSAEPDVDASLVRAGWATVTAIRAICEAPEVDLGNIHLPPAEPVGVRVPPSVPGNGVGPAAGDS